MQRLFSRAVMKFELDSIAPLLASILTKFLKNLIFTAYETMTMKNSLEIEPIIRLSSDCDMRTEPIETSRHAQQPVPVVYATLEEALRAKMEHTKQVLSKLKPEARARLIEQGSRGKENSQSTH